MGLQDPDVVRAGRAPAHRLGFMFVLLDVPGQPLNLRSKVNAPAVDTRILAVRESLQPCGKLIRRRQIRVVKQQWNDLNAALSAVSISTRTQSFG